MTCIFVRPVILNINQFLWNFANKHYSVIHIEQHTELVPVLLAFSIIWCINKGNILFMETFLSIGKSKNRIAHLYPIIQSMLICIHVNRKDQSRVRVFTCVNLLLKCQISGWKAHCFVICKDNNSCQKTTTPAGRQPSLNRSHL